MEGGEQEIPGTSSNGNKLQAVAAAKGYPPGYRFIPTDHELIFHLMNKIRNGPILIEEIKDVDLYKKDPKTLAETYPPLGEKEWYFFTSRNRKYPNGSRPDRAVGCGYWKATAADKKVYLDGKIVGFKKTLVFYQGKHQKSVKTNWIMHEFRVDQPPRNKRDANDMKLDDWVLCRIHEKTSKLKGNQQEDHEGGDLPVEYESPPQVEEKVNTQIQIVDDNEENPASVVLNHDNVAISSTAPVVAVVDNGNGINRAAFAMPEYDMNQELFALLNDHLPPSLDDIFNTPADPVQTNICGISTPGVCVRADDYI